MIIATAIKRMISFYNGNLHDIDHFLKVWALSKTIGESEGLDHRILLEADFLINAGESGYSQIAIENARQCVFRTDSGIRLLNSMFFGGSEQV